MELKKYQNRVIADLKDYLTQVNEQPTLSEAFKMFWESRHIGLAPRRCLATRM